MRRIAIFAAIVALAAPIASSAVESPVPSARAVHAIPTPLPSPAASPAGTETCSASFTVMPDPTPSGNVALHARRFSIAGYVLKSVPSGREVYATASNDPVLAAALTEYIGQKMVFSKIAFECGSESYIAVDAVVSSSTLIGNARHFTVPVPEIKEPVHVVR